MDVRRRGKGALAPFDVETFRKKGFLSFEWEKHILPLLPPLENIWKNLLVFPLGKNPSDGHGCQHKLRVY